MRKYFSTGDKYLDYKGFKKRVILPAIREINSFTDLNVVWEPYRDGRRYVAIIFDISRKEQWEGYEAYRRTMAEVNGVKHAPGQLNMFE